MATGADIPPELFRRILFDVCENASWLLDLCETVPNRKEAIKNITACSLTCVYWARICREELFRCVTIKNYEDMCAFLSLVSNTPTKFRPISEHVSWVTLVQRVRDRPWFHLAEMQPSLFRFWRLGGSDPVFYLHIEDSPNDTPGSRRSISQRLFASLPRTPPSLCFKLHCEDLTIDKPHFVTPHDLISFLQKFSRIRYLRLTNVAWSAQADFASDLLASDLLLISPFSESHLQVVVQVYHSAYAAETAWLAFSTILHGLSTQGSTITSASEYDASDENERRPTLEVLSSVQQTIFDICKSVCKVTSLNYAGFFIATYPIAQGSTVTLLKDPRAYLHHICTMAIQGHEPAGDGLLSEIQLAFYAVIPVTNVSDPIVVDSISVLCAHIASTEGFTTAGRSSNALPTHPPYSWAEIAGLCAAQAGFIRMQLEFNSHEYLVQFMEAQRAALGKLHGRITLFYHAKGGGLRAADFETLADLGDAYDHDCIKAEFW